MSKNRFLSFNLLDQLVDLNNYDEVTTILNQISVMRIGPVVEYIFLEKIHRDNLPEIKHCNKSLEIDSILKTMESSSNKSKNTSLDAHKYEFFKAPEKDIDFDDENWIAFCQRIKNASKLAGFSVPIASGIAGAVGEMVSNACEHSQRRDTALVGYRWAEGELEYAVADAGIGILKSLQTNDLYAHLVDSSQALELAIQSGVSSLNGKEGNRGTGFDTLFRSFSNLRGLLRLRTGKHSLHIEAVNSENAREGKISECCHYEGCLISVVCKKF